MTTFREIKDPGTEGPGNPIEFDPPSKRTLTLTMAEDYPNTLTGPFTYVSSEGAEPWAGTFKFEDGEMTTWVDLTFETGGEMKNGETCTGKTINTMIDTNVGWFQTIEERPPQA